MRALYSFRFAIAGAGVALLLTGCLQTRGEMREQEEKQVLSRQVKTLQASTADVNARFQDIDEDLRRLNGRIEISENRIAQNMSKVDKLHDFQEANTKAMNEKMAVYQDAIGKLEQQVSALQQQVAQLEENQKRAAAVAASAPAPGRSDKSVFMNAEDLFEKKQWKDAILEYEKYRKNNPKGKNFAMATYKIGVCFQELGLSDDAKAFYEEVLAKFPKTSESQKAQYRLKTLKK